MDAPPKLQLAKITDFGKCRLLNPRRPEVIKNSNFNTILLTTCSRNMIKDFLKFCLFVEEIDLEIGPRQPNWTKSVLLGKNEKQFVVIIFSFKYSSLILHTGITHRRPGKNYTLRKMISK